VTTVVVTDEAEQHLREIVEWWVVNRPAAPTMVVDEFVRCVSLLSIAPDAGPRFRRTDVAGVRRLVLRRTKHLVYYVHDRANAVVYVIAVWGAPKEGDPMLHEPQR
jgi:plasmid stabilization system protein ParE